MLCKGPFTMASLPLNVVWSMSRAIVMSISIVRSTVDKASSGDGEDDIIFLW